MGINRRILRLTLPAVATNITVPLLALSDTTLSGHLGSEIYLGAIAAGGMMLNVVYWIFGFLRMATTGLTAEACGAADVRAGRQVFTRSALLALLAGAVALLARKPLCSLLLAIISPDAEVAALASRYFDICILGAPAMLLTMTINGWFIGMQSTTRPMIVAISVNIINIALSVSAVVWLGMGFDGVAYGSLVATWAGVMLAMGIALKGYGKEGLWSGWREALQGGRLKKFASVSGELFARSFCIMAVTLAVTSYGASLGALTLAVNTVMMQFFIFFSYFMDGLAVSGEALCGKSAGQRDASGVMQAVHALNRWGLCAAATATLLYATLWPGITALITDVEAVREGVASMSLFLWLIPPVSAAAFLYDGFFVGLTATRRMLVVTAVATGLFFTFIAFGPKENPTLWWGFLAYLLTRGLGLAVQLGRVVHPLKGGGVG